MTEDAILQAVARGWCSPENAHKVVDPVLAAAIAREVRAALSDAPVGAALTAAAIDDLVEAGQVIERYQHPDFKPLSRTNFIFYSHAQQTVAKYRAMLNAAPRSGEAKPSRLNPQLGTEVD